MLFLILSYFIKVLSLVSVSLRGLCFLKANF
jgi:hypothetical protein